MGDVPKQLEFSEGGQNKQFEDKVKLISLSTDSIEFLEFLQSSFCQELLIENKLRIHIESRIIFFNNLDTNESIYGFFQQRENQSKAKINIATLLLPIATKIILNGLFMALREMKIKNMMP